MASRFVRPDEITLPISAGDTITIRKRLTVGEKRDAFGRMYLAGADGEYARHPVLYSTHHVLAYLLDWSLTDDRGNKVVIRDKSIEDLKSIIDNLDPDTFREIHAVIEAHEDAQAAERAEAKKTQGGESGSAVTSPSQSAAAGRLTGSAN